ncbi:MAG: hypothetical protein AB8I80_14785, partial [Anaerolineae bacterium]
RSKIDFGYRQSHLNHLIITAVEFDLVRAPAEDLREHLRKVMSYKKDTQPMGDQAATVVVLPVAIRTAWQLDLNPRSFAIMIALAASCSLLTPLEPACLLVYGPGRYRFTDYLKAGIIPALLIYGIAILMVPLLWPL